MPHRAGSTPARFGLLVQEFGRFVFTLRDTVALGSPAAAPDHQVRRALGGTFAAELPLDTQLGQQWGGSGISGGQWQRLALARILLRNAGVWILDEPTSAIDAEAEREIFAELRRTKDTRITIVVSHRAWTLRAMDRIYVIDDGSVVQCGTYAGADGTAGRAVRTAVRHPPRIGRRAVPAQHAGDRTLTAVVDVIRQRPECAFCAQTYWVDLT